MKVKARTVEETIVGAEKEMQFSIDTDNHIIFEILRDKMYSDKIGAVAREVSSNSRDANREAGRPDTPVVVEIVKPNKFASIGHQSVVFHDNGLGITPDRMADVFIKYASSTKRDSNNETGGFGLGAKTPFAYSDTFTVITVCDWEEPITKQKEILVDVIEQEYDDEGNFLGTKVVGKKKEIITEVIGHHPEKRMEYTYNAIIDESNKGKMILFDTEETTNPTGTKIIVPIKTDDDRYEFEKKAMHSTEFWGEGIEYKGFARERKDIQFIIDEPEFSIVERDDNENYALLIDGIHYPLNTSSVDINNNGVGSNYTILLKFGTGDLTISANRESVQYDEATIEAIKNRYQEIKVRIAASATEYVENLPSYKEACKFAYYMTSASLKERENLEDDYLRTIVEAYNANKEWGYHRKTILSEDKEKFKDVTFNGKELKAFVKLKHHGVAFVKKPRYADGKTNYQQTSKLNINDTLVNSPIYYADARKDKRRNETIWDDNETFLLFLPKGLDKKAELDEMNEFITEFDLSFDLYGDVEKKKSVSTVSSYRSPVDKENVWLNYRKYNYGEFVSNSLKMDRKTKKIDGRDFKDLLYYKLSRLSELPNVTREVRDKVNLIQQMTNKTVIFVNEITYRNWIGLTPIKEMEKEYAKLEKKWQKEWQKQTRKKVIVDAFGSILGRNMDYFKEVQTQINPILPKCVQEVFVFDKDGNIMQNEKPFVEQEIKFDRKGLKQKLEAIFEKKYPMLMPFLEKNLKNWYRTPDIPFIQKTVEDYIEGIKKVNHG